MRVLLLLLGLVLGCERATELGATGQGRASGGELCERYADAATRVVNGWYPTGFDKASYGGLIGALGTTSVPERTIGWSCGSKGLFLELDLPAYDGRHESAEDALGDILSALPWRELDAKGDGVRIVVKLVKTGDVAVFEPVEG